MKYEYLAPNLASFPGCGVNRPDPLNKKAAKGLCPGGLTFLRASLNPFDNFPAPRGSRESRGVRKQINAEEVTVGYTHYP
jgi:hypothetical protein